MDSYYCHRLLKRPGTFEPNVGVTCIDIAESDVREHVEPRMDEEIN
jgi:hypothetical protein